MDLILHILTLLLKVLYCILVQSLPGDNDDSTDSERLDNLPCEPGCVKIHHFLCSFSLFALQYVVRNELKRRHQTIAASFVFFAT